MTNATDYVARVAKLEAAGFSTSDAQAVVDAETAFERTATRRSFTEYAGFTIYEGQPGHWVVSEDQNGFPVNPLPGATYGTSEENALQLVDVFLAVDRDPAKFWHLLRAIQRATRIEGGDR